MTYLSNILVLQGNSQKLATIKIYFLLLIRNPKSDSRKSAQKGPKSDLIFFKIGMSPFYSQMRLSTKFEENLRGEGF